MKLITKFSEFLDNTVNLNQSRIDTLTSRTATIENFVRGSDYGVKIKTFSTQGSWAQKTIIKPVSSKKEFDADMVVFVHEKEGWQPRDYIEKLYSQFKQSTTYANIVGRKSRCVTIDYSGDFHLDVVPVVICENWLLPATYQVCNRNTNEFELTDGDGFKNWWKDKDKLVSNYRLIKTARLIKYLRDTKTTFSCKSILLTTLIGNTIDDGDISIFSSTLEDGFEDVPSTLRTVIGRMDDYLQGQSTRPDVKNPILKTESFTRNWTEDQYQNFQRVIHTYRVWIDEAYSESDREESVRKWRKLFGDKFAPDVVLKASAAAESRSASDPRSIAAQNLLRDMNNDVASGFVDNVSLLQLINYGVDGYLSWSEIQKLVQSNFDLAVDDEAKDIARINFYQVYLHQGLSLPSEIVAEIECVVEKYSGSVEFTLCGNLLLGRATKQMADNCTKLYDPPLETWPIMRLAPW